MYRSIKLITVNMVSSRVLNFAIRDQYIQLYHLTLNNLDSYIHRNARPVFCRTITRYKVSSAVTKIRDFHFKTYKKWMDIFL